jgi:hypothetical protein
MNPDGYNPAGRFSRIFFQCNISVIQPDNENLDPVHLYSMLFVQPLTFYHLVEDP